MTLQTDPLYKDLLLFFCNNEGYTISGFIEKYGGKYLKNFDNDDKKFHSKIRNCLKWLRYRGLIKRLKKPGFQKSQIYELRRTEGIKKYLKKHFDM